MEIGVYVYVCLYVCPSKHDLHENAETMDRGKVQTERAQHENAETMDSGRVQTDEHICMHRTNESHQHIESANH